MQAESVDIDPVLERVFTIYKISPAGCKNITVDKAFCKFLF